MGYDNILPVVIPTSVAYHRIAYTMSMIMAKDDLKVYYYNNYSQLYLIPKFIWCGKTNEIIYGFQGGDFTNIPFFELSEYHEVDNFIDIIIRSIDASRYVFVSGIDEFYIETARYENMHFIHNIFIYGYNQEEKILHVMGYDKTINFNMYKISFDSLLKSCRSEYAEPLMIAIAINKTDLDLDLKQIKKGFEQYMRIIDTPTIKNTNANEKYSDFRAEFGIYTLDFLYHYLSCVENDIIPADEFDLKSFRMLWEHKNIMQDKLEFLNAKYQINNNKLGAIYDIVNNASRIRAKSVKFSLSKNKKVLSDMKELILELIELETLFLNMLIDEISKLIGD